MAASWDGKVTPYIEKKLRTIEIDAKNCSNVAPVGRGEFDILECNTNFTVKLRDHYCDYKKWQISGIPCKHAARCILRMNQKLEDYYAH